MYLKILRMIYTIPYAIFVCAVIIYNYFKIKRNVTTYNNIDVQGLVFYYFEKYSYLELHLSTAFWVLIFTILFL